jgi:hypothetical protein
LGRTGDMPVRISTMGFWYLARGSVRGPAVGAHAAPEPPLPPTCGADERLFSADSNPSFVGQHYTYNVMSDCKDALSRDKFNRAEAEGKSCSGRFNVRASKASGPPVCRAEIASRTRFGMEAYRFRMYKLQIKSNLNRLDLKKKI